MDTSKQIRQIENFLNRVMCADRPPLIREIRKIKAAQRRGGEKKERGPRPPGDRRGRSLPTDEPMRQQVERLLKRAERSVRQAAHRKAAMPTISLIPELPITDKKDEIVKAIQSHRVVIISGETGSGKTTQIPKFCMAAGKGVRGTIGCTQPRRIAAMNVSARIAEELGESLGQSVGYKIRFDDKSAQNSIIKVMTDGILLAETQKDGWLNEYDTLIVDEAHERSLNIDFTLGILRDLTRKRRDLTLVITSATIDTEKFSKAFDDAPVIEVSGRMYPVEVRHRPLQGGHDTEPDDQGYVEAACEAVEEIRHESRDGDILIFMPTEQDITETIEILRGRRYVGVTVLPLYARLSAGEQSKIFHRGAGRKIIVSTNVAETSLTIPGIKYVVDTGLARIPHYSPRTRTTALPVTPISRSSADQRKGRCGRVANGICIRLYDEEDYASRPLFTSPEILRSNLAEVILRMIALRLGDVASFPFIDAPSPKSVKDGFDTLLELGAINVQKGGEPHPRGGAPNRRGNKKTGAKRALPDSRNSGKNGDHERSQGGKKRKKEYVLTEKGKVMARIPVDPKLSRILIEADERGCLNEAAIIASALSISDPRQRPQDKKQQADQKHALFKDPASDFISLLNIWNAYHDAQQRLKSRSKVRSYCTEHYLSFKRLREWSDIHRQIRSVLKEHGIKGEHRIQLESGSQGLKAKAFDIGGHFYSELHKALLSGYLGNIGHKKEKNLYHAAKGQKAMIFPGSGLFNSAGNWIVAAEYVETSQLFARTVATIDPGWLEELGRDLCTYTWSSPHWEKKRGEVVASEQVSLFGLIIVPERPVSYGKINPSEAGEIFIRNALVEGEVARPFPFMDHNQALIDELRELEEKTRKRDILVMDEDIFLFYQNRLDRDFYNIRTFAKYLKDKRDDAFLRMTKADLQQKSMDGVDLSGFPDAIQMGSLAFGLEYGFEPGAETDGVTLKVPVPAAASVDPQALEWLVPGLFKEKITALIKGLPKSHRVKLLPASQKAAIIAETLSDASRQGRPLFSELSRFVKERFNADIPASAWSDEGLEDHLKMRISIRDEGDHEVSASRNKTVLKSYAEGREQGNSDEASLEAAKGSYEREAVTEWDFGTLAEAITIVGGDLQPAPITYELFPALSVEDKTCAIRLFKNRETATASHKEGVRTLFIFTFEKDFNALKKDIRGAARLKRYASFFGNADALNQGLFRSITRHLFAVNLRSKEAFDRHADTTLPKVYATGQRLISMVTDVCEATGEAEGIIKQLSIKGKTRPQLASLAEELKQSLDGLISKDFLELYAFDRIDALPRYVAALRIRGERAEIDLVRDRKKADEVAIFTHKLNQMVDTLDGDASKEKADAVERFFWMIEEYKVSLFAQELKTPVKISPKRLNTLCSEISRMI